MICFAVFFLILCSGSFFCAARFQRRFEEVLPVTMAGLILLIFLFGVAGFLAVGVYAVLLAAALLYAGGIFLIVRRKNAREFLRNLVTPGLLIFGVSFFLLIYVNRGRLATFFDEFSHWVDIVKVMTLLDDFGTNPASMSSFPSYPPAGSIFSYFLQKLAILTGFQQNFTEWLVFTTANLFLIIPMFPFLRSFGWKQLFKAILTAGALFLCPLILLPYFYEFAGGDAPLSVLLGCGMALLITARQQDLFHTLQISLYCALLVLCKDVGLLLSVFLAVLFCIRFLLEKKSPEGWGKSRWLTLGQALLPLAALLVCSLLWRLELALSQVPMRFREPTDLGVLLNLLLGRDPTYRQEVLHTFGRGFLLDRGIHLAHTGGTTSFLVIFCIETTVLYLGIRLWNKTHGQAAGKNIWITWSFLGLTGLYTLGLIISYLFQFSQVEALALSSFERYLCIPAVAGVIAAAAIYLSAGDTRNTCLISLAVLTAVLFLTPMEPVWNLVSRDLVDNSRGERAPYTELNEKIDDSLAEPSRIYLICQESDSYDYYVEKYSLRPHVLSKAFSLGEPFYEGDIWTASVSPDQWQQDLVENYDYVAILRANDYFREHFSCLFRDPSAIADNSLFLVNRETGLLEPVS